MLVSGYPFLPTPTTRHLMYSILRRNRLPSPRAVTNNEEMLCIHGHTLLEGGDVCAQGHAGADDLPPPGTPPVQQQGASITDLQNLIHQMLNIQNNSLQSAANPTRPGNKVKPDRPTIKPNASDGDWQLFLDSWGRYKQMCKLVDTTEIRNELRCTCAPEVNKLLFDIIGSSVLDNCSEDELLKHIRSVAVQGSHKEVHRQKFQALSQEEGEMITNFLAKLKAQAHLCEFNVPCPNCSSPVSYSTNMVSGQLIAGLHNSDHQAKVLAEATTLTTLQLKFDKLVSLETTDQATKRLNMSVSPSASVSTTNIANSSNRYQQRYNTRNSNQSTRNSNNNQNTRNNNNNQNTRNSNNSNENVFKCKGCGLTFHPNNKSMKRSDCPAFNLNCDNCGIKGHYKRVCRKPLQQRTTSNSNISEEAQAESEQNLLVSEETSYIFVNNVVIEETSNNETVAIPHMEWNGTQFEAQPPLPPPKMTITIEVITDKNALPPQFSFPPGFQPKPVITTTLADSGAQTCSGDLRLLFSLGCTKENLFPTTHGIRGVTDTRLQLLGVLPTRITVGIYNTNQIMYFAENTHGCLLSEKALRDLRILPEKFPSVCAVVSTSTVSMSLGTPVKAKCGCPKRLQSPEQPASIPFSPIESNESRNLDTTILCCKCF